MRELIVMPVSPLHVKRALVGVRFPASRAEILAELRSKGAPLEVMDVLNRLADRRYVSPADVSNEVADR